MTRKKKEKIDNSEQTDQIQIVDSFPIYNLDNPTEVTALTKLVNSDNAPIGIRIKTNEEEGFSFGYAVPRNHPTSQQYLADYKSYNSSDKTIADQMNLARKLYIHEGIIGTVIDTYIDLSVTELKIENIKNKKLDFLVQDLFKNINKIDNNISKGIGPVMRAFAKDFYLCGNVFAYTKWKTKNFKKLNEEFYVPISMINIDPTIIEIPKESVQFGNKQMFIKLSAVLDTKTLLNNKQKLLESLPTKFRNRVKKKQDIPLDPKFVSHLKRRGSPYSGWGVPYLTRAFNAVASKTKIRELDDTTVDGLINSIVIFKIGDPKFPQTFDPARLRAFKALLNQPAPSLQLVWAWDIEYIQVNPKSDVLNFSDKYKDANNDIIYALGFPVSLLTGIGERAGDIWASITFLLERFEEFRIEFRAYLEDIIDRVIEENEFDEEDYRINLIRPKINKEDLRNIILAFYDRGLISKNTALREAGYIRDDEVTHRKFEKKEIDEILGKPELPHDSPMSPTDKETQNREVPKEKKTTTLNEQPTKMTPKITPKTKGQSLEKVLGITNELLVSYNLKPIVISNYLKQLRHDKAIDFNTFEEDNSIKIEDYISLIDNAIASYGENITARELLNSISYQLTKDKNGSVI